MHYSSIENLSKSFGIRQLFSGISFHIEEGDKIALVARNGSGKTTLLRILAGLDTADEGTVWIHKDVKVIFLQQQITLDEEASVWDNILSIKSPMVQLVKDYEMSIENGNATEEELNELITKITEAQAWNFDSELKQILGKLDLHHLNEKVKNLSGGQKKRVALAQALITAQIHEGKCLMILDEPTNHLDVDMIEWLENYLASQKSTLILVTHDRYFLDAVCNEIMELDQEGVYKYQGNYDYFLEQKAQRHEGQASELLKDKNIYRRELEWMRKQPKARTTKSKSRQDAFTGLEEKVKRKNDNEEISIQVKMTRMGGKVLEMKKVYKSFGDKIILQGFDYTFKKGERIGIVGKNGCGKSTFLKIALGALVPDSGKINHGDTVVFGNFAQEGLQYKEDKRAIEYVKDFAEFFPLADGSKISATQFMEKFGFNAQQQFTPLSKLSGGEKRRLHLLSILFRNPNFLVLDEPTNDLDLQTLRTLEEFLQDFPGCLLIVSHDRYFMDRLVDHLFAFEGNGDIKDFPGNYSQYRLWKQLNESKSENSREKIVETSSNKTKVISADAKAKFTFKEKSEFEKLEKDIPSLEKEKHLLQVQMNNGGADFKKLQEISERISELILLLDKKENRWLELSEKAIS